jgi:hypothetical protein
MFRCESRYENPQPERRPNNVSPPVSVIGIKSRDHVVSTYFLVQYTINSKKNKKSLTFVENGCTGIFKILKNMYFCVFEPFRPHLDKCANISKNSKTIL